MINIIINSFNENKCETFVTGKDLVSLLKINHRGTFSIFDQSFETTKDVG